MRLLTAMHPTDNQKRVLAMIAASPTPTVAASQISTDANVVAARNMLMKLGMITFANGEAALTDQGTKIAQDENIIDQSGQLTPDGEQLVGSNSQGTPNPAGASGAPGNPDADMGMDQMGGDSAGMPPADPTPGGADDFNFESVDFSLLKELLG